MYRQQTPFPMEPRERRIILVGKTGNGKSSTGNSLLQRKAFHHKMSPNAVTETCMMQSAISAWNGIRYRIVDTPGLLDTEKSVAERALGIQKSLDICPNPHAFLLIFSANNRMTPDEQFTIDMLRIIFGDKVSEQAIVVFTHGEKFESDMAFKRFWTENEHFVKLVQLCGDRVIKIENNLEFHSVNEGTGKIIRIVEEMSDAGTRVYKYNELKTHKQVIEEHSKRYHGNGDIHAEVSELVQKLGQKLSREKWKMFLYGGALFAGGAMGASYVASLAYGANAVATTGIGASMMNAISASRVGAAVVNNGAAVGTAVLSTAWNVATKVKFW